MLLLAIVYRQGRAHCELHRRSPSWRATTCSHTAPTISRRPLFLPGGGGGLPVTLTIIHVHHPCSSSMLQSTSPHSFFHINERCPAPITRTDNLPSLSFCPLPRLQKTSNSLFLLLPPFSSTPYQPFNLTILPNAPPQPRYRCSFKKRSSLPCAQGHMKAARLPMPHH